MNNALSDILKHWYEYDVRTQKVKFISESNPTTDINPEDENVIWYNKATGEIFICTDNTPNKNVWIGTSGTVVAPSTLTKFDIFEDGSAILLLTFDGTLNDLGGKYKPTKIDGAPRYGVGKYGKCILSSWRFQVTYTIPELKELDVVTISAWVNWNGYCCTMPFGFYRYDIYNCCGYFGFNTACSDIYGTGNIPSRQWVHIVAEFHNGSYYDNKLWINGESVELSQKLSRMCEKNCVITEDFHIFGWGANRSYRNFGAIDQLRMFNRSLTDTEVKLLANEV